MLFRSTILFDGALPLSKRLERISRLEQNNRRVQQLRASYATAPCPIPRNLSSIPYAFLAPALREALAETLFASKTRIVPGEADDWCALHAKNHARSIIFTSDTDLVLYDYPPETLIVFLHDADLGTGIKAYSPEQMREKLQLKSLTPFAYALGQNPQDTANLLIQNARRVDLESPAYLEFSRRYIVDASISVLPIRAAKPPLPLQTLDVRVSEFVDQTLSNNSKPLVYLPLLMEDPNQASGWNMGHDIRWLSYSLLAPPGSVIHEYRRKAQGVAAQEIIPYSAADIQAPAVEIERQVTALKLWAARKTADLQLIWPLFALSLVLADLNTPPAIALVLRVLNGDFDNTWAFIQLTARLQAAMYSLRMLKQIVSVWLSLGRAGNAKLHECLISLDKDMAGFPSIGNMFNVPGQAQKVLAHHERLRAMIEEIYLSAGAEVPNEQVSNKKKKRQAREADRKKKKTEQRQQLRF